MPTFLQSILTYVQDLLTREFSVFDLMVFSINLIIYLFAPKIRARFKQANSHTKEVGPENLRRINLLLFSLYFIPLFVPGVGGQISMTALTFLMAYLVIHLANGFILERFGNRREVDEETILNETYQSEMFGLLFLILVGVAAFLSIVNIWNITDWLKATSVFGGILIIAFSTKDVWAPDNIHGLILLYNSDIEPGAVIRVDELNLLAVVKRITLSQIVFRDLRQRHEILLPNARFRGSKIEILSKATAKGLVDFIDFKIGYGIPGTEVEDFLISVWERAREAEPAIADQAKPRICLVDNGDHAVTWRLFYTVSRVYKLITARFAVNRAAYDRSLETGIDLSTPHTHQARIQHAPLQESLLKIAEPGEIPEAATGA